MVRNQHLYPKKSIPFPSNDEQLLLSISLTDLDPSGKKCKQLERGHVEGAEEEESIAAIFASSVEANRSIAEHWNRESTTRS